MTGPLGNSEFCFPSTSMFPSASPWGTLSVSGNQNSLFPLWPVIKCLLLSKLLAHAHSPVIHFDALMCLVLFHVDKITDGNKTHILFTVHCVIFKQAEEKLLAKGQDKEYAPIHGLPDFTVPSAKLAFGEDSEVIKNNLVCVFF